MGQSVPDSGLIVLELQRVKGNVTQTLRSGVEERSGAVSALYVK